MKLSAVCLRVLQPMEEAVLAELVRHISLLFDTNCLIDHTKLDIASSYSQERQQYNSTMILARLKATTPSQMGLALALMTDDLYSLGLNFVFGEAEIAGRVGIISLARLRPSFGSKKKDSRLLQARACKEATHELGHMLGLRHCTQSRCVMYLSNTLADTDKKSDRFCPDCTQSLAEAIV
ncbi:MAG: archaemetzincin family Zn-dependent metalloprotease [Acidobacteriota bacterium]